MRFNFLLLKHADDVAFKIVENKVRTKIVKME